MVAMGVGIMKKRKKRKRKNNKNISVNIFRSRKALNTLSKRQLTLLSEMTSCSNLKRNNKNLKFKMPKTAANLEMIYLLGLIQ